eukprot:GHVT01092885.1.p1 GENE.GHVT01092885.1~~GHVT01092885.1.p1  ORF type:complete len:1186 (+),score=223.82 GHVT01092885.1:1831-5388(+)
MASPAAPQPCVLGHPLPECPSFVVVGTQTVKGILVEEFKSLLTGVRVFLGHVESPLVNGFFTLPTEAHDDDGLPHTLEHLIFLGSQLYPYKGILDLLAARCLSHGTNAWTATDHTTYTVTTAGLEGFLNILPVYVDHILRPTLEEDAFFTEVHHVGEDGTSAGVVYAEMQARENTADSIVTREVLSLLYPGDSGYKYETGGMLKDLRATSNAKVKAYHAEYYRWTNLHLIITGRLDRTKVLAEIATIERAHLGIPTDGPIPENAPGCDKIRPWTAAQNVAPLEKDVKSSVCFPADDEESGIVVLAWRGVPWSDYRTRQALDILGAYLTDSNVSPLVKQLVEVEHPFCGSVEYSTENFKEISYGIEFRDVPHKPSSSTRACTPAGSAGGRVELVATEVARILKQQAEKGIDMDRIRSLIAREAMQELRSYETQPHDHLADSINEYCIYGEDFGQLRAVLDTRQLFEELSQESEAFWKQLLVRYFVDRARVEVCGLPSVRAAAAVQKFEKELKKVQVESHGAEKLKEFAIYLTGVKERQAKPPPSALLAQIPFARVENVSLFDSTPFRNFEEPCSGSCRSSLAGASGVPSIDASSASAASCCSSLVSPCKCGLSSPPAWIPAAQLPLLQAFPALLQLSSIPSSDFVRFQVAGRLPENLPVASREDAHLLAELLFECDVVLPNSGAVLTHSELTDRLLATTVSYSASVGFDGSRFNPGEFGDFLVLSMVAPVRNFEAALELLLGVILATRVTTDRLKVVIKTMSSSLARKKREGKTIVHELEKAIRMARSSTVRCCGLGAQSKRLKTWIKEAALSGAELDATAAALSELLAATFKSSRMLWHVVADFDSLPECWLRAWDVMRSPAAPLLASAVGGKRTPPSLSPGRGDVSPPMGRTTTAHKCVSAAAGLGIVPPSFHCAVPDSLRKYGNSILVGLGSTDASYSLLTVPAPAGYFHSELAALFVLTEFWSMMEGPLFRNIRGAGYAYGCDLSYSPALGQITLRLSPATDLPGALITAFKDFNEHIQDKTLYQDHLVQTAKAATLFSIIKWEETLADYSDQTFLSAFKDLPLSFWRSLLIQVGAVTGAQVAEVSTKYLSRLSHFVVNPETFRAGESLSVVTNTDKVLELVGHMESMGVGRVMQLPRRELIGYLEGAGSASENFLCSGSEDEDGLSESGAEEVSEEESASD